MLDVTTEWGQHAEQRLRSNIIAWLTTVGSDGRPYTVPIWFLWDGRAVLIFSQPQKQKIRNLHKNARVTCKLSNILGISSSINVLTDFPIFTNIGQVFSKLLG